jgi:hypothetical protein
LNPNRFRAASQDKSSDDLFKMLTEEKIKIFQDVTVIRHDKKIDLRVTPVEARMRP